MKTISYTYDKDDVSLTVTSKYIGGKPMRGLKQNTNYHIVSVKNNKTNTVETFEFWNSLIHLNRTKKVGYTEFKDVELHEDELKDALTCWFSDALAADMGIDDFVDEYGYGGEKISKVLSIYHECEKAKENILNLLGCNIDKIYDMANDLEGR